MCGCHGRGSDHRRALPAVESPTCARVADARKGGGPTSERNTSTLHFKVIRTIFFELCVSLVIILDRPVHQESTKNPGKGPLSYPTAAQKSIRYRRMAGKVGGSPWSTAIGRGSDHRGAYSIRLWSRPCKKISVYSGTCPARRDRQHRSRHKSSLPPPHPTRPYRLYPTCYPETPQLQHWSDLHSSPTRTTGREGGELGGAE